MQRIKCVVVGDHGVGKTNLVRSYAADSFCPDHKRTEVCDNYYVKKTMYKLSPVSIAAWDSASDDLSERLRLIMYKDTDVFLVCHSLSDQTSLKHAATKWFEEIRARYPDTPVVIVGTKADEQFAEDPNTSKSKGRGSRSVKTKSTDPLALEVGEKWNTKYVMECSAKTQVGLEQVFQKVAKAALEGRKGSSRCVIM